MAIITATLSNGTQLVNEEIDSLWFEQEENEGLTIAKVNSIIISDIEVVSIFSSHETILNAINFLEENDQECDAEIYIAYLLLERNGSDNNIDAYSSAAKNTADLNFDCLIEEAKLKFAENKIYDLLAEIKPNIEQSQYDAIKHSMSPSRYANKLFEEDYLIIEVEGTSYVFKRN